MMEEIMNEKVPDSSAVLRWLGQMGLLVKMGKTVLCNKRSLILLNRSKRQLFSRLQRSPKRKKRV